MIEQQILDAIVGASPAVVIGLVLIIFIRALPNILIEYRKIEEEHNEGKRADNESQTNILAGATKAVETALGAMQETQAQSREFYMNKLGDTLSALHLLEARVQDLEDQIEERDRRISELERENEQLHHEIDALRRKIASRKIASHKLMEKSNRTQDRVPPEQNPEIRGIKRRKKAKA